MAAVLAPILGAAGSPLDEINRLSQLPPLDLARLKSGEIVTNRGDGGNFARGICLEAGYFIRAPMPAVGEALLHWNPTPHPEMEVRLYRDYPWPGSADAFKALHLSSKTPDDRWLLNSTLEIADGAAGGDLHLTAAELDLVRQLVPKKEAAPPAIREQRVIDAWREILRRRSESLGRGGLAAVAAYGSDNSISPRSEFSGLLSLASRAAKHFQPITSAKPLKADASNTADEAVGYWEATRVRNHTTLQLGVFARRKSADSWQLLDCVYYPSDTYFMALDLFQLWPLEDGTLVWQVGFVSAPFRSYLGGVDRFVASKQMAQETLDTIKAFRSDIEKRQ